MKTTEHCVYAKIMLFGEYGVLCGGRALTMPLRNFSGTFRFPLENQTEQQIALNKLLKKYQEFLAANTMFTDEFGIDVQAFQSDLDSGLYFASDIPHGYGAGSSGALVAAVYRRYAAKGKTGHPESDLQQLQKQLAALEAYFHGSSSGIDPISCYLGVPLEFSSAEAIMPVQLHFEKAPSAAGFFLLDTGLPRKTDKLVKLFFEKNKDADFQEMLLTQYIPSVSSCITSLIKGNESKLEKQLQQLSGIQYHYFKEMIPVGLKDLWRQGLDTGAFTLKLCGAGGGGFILGYSKNFLSIDQILKNYQTIEISL